MVSRSRSSCPWWWGTCAIALQDLYRPRRCWGIRAAEALRGGGLRAHAAAMRDCGNRVLRYCTASVMRRNPPGLGDGVDCS